jgi:tRNA(adenine34) deaminase
VAAGRGGSLLFRVGGMLPNQKESDILFMAIALEEAKRGAEQGEVPVGALLVSSAGEELGRAHNAPVRLMDPTAHAEILALRQGAERSGNYRLAGATLYVTIEPCSMCAGAILHARLARLVFGARDPKAGAVVSLFQILRDPRLNHQVKIREGVLEEECQALIRSFFQVQRLGHAKSQNA